MEKCCFFDDLDDLDEENEEPELAARWRAREREFAAASRDELCKDCPYCVEED